MRAARTLPRRAELQIVCGELTGESAPSGDRGGTAARGQFERPLHLEAAAEREGEAGGEAVSCAVRVRHRAGKRRCVEAAGAAFGCRPRGALGAGGARHQLWPRVQLAAAVALAAALPAVPRRVELN